MGNARLYYTIEHLLWAACAVALLVVSFLQLLAARYAPRGVSKKLLFRKLLVGSCVLNIIRALDIHEFSIFPSRTGRLFAALSTVLLGLCALTILSGYVDVICRLARVRRPLRFHKLLKAIVIFHCVVSVILGITNVIVNLVRAIIIWFALQSSSSFLCACVVESGCLDCHLTLLLVCSVCWRG